jgi:soluble lytic murein transglycosylase
VTWRSRLLGGSALLAALVAGLLLGDRTGRSAPDLSRHDGDLVAAAREVAIDPDLVRAVVAAESGGDTEAVSKVGARGLMQLMPATAREEAARRGIEPPADDDLTGDPRLNLRLGAGYLARLLERYGGEVPFALAAYNAGPGNLHRWREQAPDAAPLEVVAREGFPATRAYVARVLELREVYRQRR